LGITVQDFMVGGGIILLILSITDLLFSERTRSTSELGVVPLGIPLIVGPSVLTTLVLQVDQVGLAPTLASFILNILITYGVFRSAGVVVRLMGEAGTQAVSKVANLFLAAIAIMLIALRPLLPPGSLRARRGLPSVILLRGLVAGTFLASEVYLPYFLISEYALTPALAGLALSVAALSWSGASWIQGTFSNLLGDVLSMRLGVSLLLVAVTTMLACSIFAAAPIVAIVGWIFAGIGMGTMSPRISVLTLRLSTHANQGFNSSALSISDSITAASALALTAVIFQSLEAFGGSWAFTGCFLLSATLGLGALALGGRVRPQADV